MKAYFVVEKMSKIWGGSNMASLNHSEMCIFAQTGRMWIGIKTFVGGIHI